MTGPVVVAHIITRLDVGGAQETAVQICAGLDRQAFRPVLIAGPDAGSGGSLAAEARAAGVEVVVEPALRGPIRPWSEVAAVRSLGRELRRRAPAVVHTHSSKAGVLGRVAAHRTAVPAVVHMVHGWSFNDHQARPVAACYRAIERRLAPWTSALAVVTAADRDAGVAAGIGRPDQYALVRSGIPAEAVPSADRATLRARFGWKEDEQVIVTVGRLEAQKDPLALVRAFDEVVRTAPRARLVLVGDGSLAAAVDHEVATRGLAGRVDRLGLRQDVDDLLAAGDLFALSSRFEGLPRAVLQAVRAGRPVVATDAGGVREVIEPGRTGWLVPPAAPQELAAAVREALQDPAEAGRRALAAAARLPAFTEAGMVAATEALYRSLLERHGVPEAVRVPELVP